MALAAKHGFGSDRRAAGAAQRRAVALGLAARADSASLVLCWCCCRRSPENSSSFRSFGWAMILGMIALSLMFLGGYGGMVSLAQMTVAGVAGYMVAVFGASSLPYVSLFWPWWVAVPIAIAIAVAFGALTGALSARTEGIYTIMITLAIAAAFFYLTLQNWPIFNGFNGFTTIPAPIAFGRQLEASITAVLPDPVLRRAQLRRGPLHLAGAVWPRFARCARQSAAHGGDRLQRHRSSHRCLCFRGDHCRGRRNPVGLAEQSNLARSRSALMW